MADTSQRFHGGLESLWNSCHTRSLLRIQLFTKKVKDGVRKLLPLTVRRNYLFIPSLYTVQIAANLPR